MAMRADVAIALLCKMSAARKRIIHRRTRMGYSREVLALDLIREPYTLSNSSDKSQSPQVELS